MPETKVAEPTIDEVDAAWHALPEHPTYDDVRVALTAAAAVRGGAS